MMFSRCSFDKSPMPRVRADRYPSSQREHGLLLKSYNPQACISSSTSTTKVSATPSSRPETPGKLKYLLIML